MGAAKHTGILPTILENGIYNSTDYFIESRYKAEGSRRTYPCFLVTKKGCELLANKLSGKRGILFTQAYVERFNEMEEVIGQPQLPDSYRELYFCNTLIWWCTEIGTP